MKLSDFIKFSANNITSTHEGVRIEYKETFSWSSRNLYVKSIAAFANNKGGALIFGIKNTRQLLGLPTAHFDDLDESLITEYLNSTFSPEITYAKHTLIHKGKVFGVIKVEQLETKPAIAIKNNGDIREADIYYRYNARSEKIKFPELNKLFIKAKDSEQKKWVEVFKKIAKVGPSNVGIMNMVKGEIDTARGRLLIDEKLLPRIKFIRKGKLSTSGKPTLRLIGDVVPVSLTRVGKNFTGVRITGDPKALAMRPDNAAELWPHRSSDVVNLVNKKLKLKTPFNSHDFLCIKKFSSVNEKTKPNLVYKPYSDQSPRYSGEMVNWITKTYKKDSKFFEKARKFYKKERSENKKT